MPPSKLHYSIPVRLFALLLGIFCHATFVTAIALMAHALYFGLSRPLFSAAVPFSPSTALAINFALILQFPLIHSFLLTTKGQQLLARITPQATHGVLWSTIYALIASLQLLLTFSSWQPLSNFIYSSTGWLLNTWCVTYVLAWLFLAKAIFDAGASLQSGYVGWSSVAHNRPPRYPPMPDRGLFQRCRQPIYLGFFLVILTAPTWTLDHALLLLFWGSYCIIGPRAKERRFATLFGDSFAKYQSKVPYFLPRLRNK